MLSVFNMLLDRIKPFKHLFCLFSTGDRIICPNCTLIEGVQLIIGLTQRKTHSVKVLCSHRYV